jgi:hypothetical protein
MKDYDGRYDPQQFIVPPSLGKDGKSGRVSFHAQQQHIRLADHFSRSTKFPFESQSDFFRWALWDGIQHAQQLEPHGVESWIHCARVILDLAREEKRKEEFLHVFDVIRQQVNAFTSNHDIESAKDFIHRTRLSIARLPETPAREWRFKMQCESALDEFKAYFQPEDSGE